MKRNTEAIVRLAAEKSHNTRSRVLVALQDRRLRDLPPTGRKDPPIAARPGKSDAAKDAQIARLQERVRTLEREVQRLREENAVLCGRLAERS